MTTTFNLLEINKMSTHATVGNVPVVKHVPGNVRDDKKGKFNNINNRTFAVLTEAVEGDVVRQSLVEVVRQGPKNIRIRRNLEENAGTELVSKTFLSELHKRENMVEVVSTLVEG